MTLRKGKCLWRAQLGSDKKLKPEFEKNAILVDVPFSDERMKPLPNKAKEGRINPKGIPCLYLAMSKTVAILEVRPWMGSKITIGKFEVIRDQKLAVFNEKVTYNPIDILERLSQGQKLPEEEIRQIVWSDVCEAFTKSTDRDDDTADYAPSQVIAEYLKKRGIDGLAYRSAFSTRKLNIALFDIEAARIGWKDLVEIDRIKVRYGRAPFAHYS